MWSIDENLQGLWLAGPQSDLSRNLLLLVIAYCTLLYMVGVLLRSVHKLRLISRHEHTRYHHTTDNLL